MRTEWLLNDDFLEICLLDWESGNEFAPMQKGGGKIMCGHQFCQKGRLKTENTGFQTTFACKTPPPFALCYINFCTRYVLKVATAFALYIG